MKQFLKKHEKIVKILLMLLIFVLISVISTLILSMFGVVYFEGAELRINQAMFDSFKTSWYGCILVVLIQVAVTSLLSFVPGASMAFIYLLQEMYNNPPLAFLIAFSGVMFSSFMLYALGRFGGYRLCERLLGKDDCEKASDLLNNRGTIFFPIMMLFPVFPDDALTMVAGTLKMSLKWFVPSIVFGRGIGVATIIFGLGSIPFEKFTTPWHWIIFILICAVGIVAVFWAANKFNKYMQRKKAAASPAAEVAEAPSAEEQTPVAEVSETPTAEAAYPTETPEEEKIPEAVE